MAESDLSGPDPVAFRPGTRPARRPALPARIRRGTLSILVCLFLVSLAMPQETWISIGPIRLSPYRVVLIASLAPCLMILLSGRAGRLGVADVLIGLHGLWASIALFAWGGFDRAWEPAGVYLIEAVGSYLLARSLIRSRDDFERTIRFLFMIVVAILPFTVIEMLTGAHILRDFFQGIFGGPPVLYEARRFGLARALGPFQHPILYGVFVSCMFGAVYYVLGEGRLGPKSLLRNGLIALATFASLSAGPYVALLVQAVLIGWDRLTRRLQARWWLLAVAFLAAYGVVDALSNRTPFKVFISYLTLNPRTAYYRLIVWNHGTDEVGRHPFLGIGMRDWERPTWLYSSSIDNFWLLEAIRYGLPTVVFLAAAMLYIAVSLIRLKGIDPATHRCRAAWLTTVAGLTVAGATVHYWNAVFCLFFFVIGSGVWLTRARQAPVRKPWLRGSGI